MSRYPLKWPSDMPVARETANMNYSVVHCARTQLMKFSSYMFFPAHLFCETHSLCLKVHQHVLH